VIDHCLRCTDPKGRVASDCSIDYARAPGGSITSSGDSFSFASCTFSWGTPKATGTTCYYPGADSCVIDEEEDFHSLSCTYPDGSGSSMATDPDQPLLDPLIGRPDDLPAPGECITEVVEGSVCTTCAHDDLSAMRSCHFLGVSTCSVSIGGACMGDCTLADGSRVQVCNSPRGPQLIR
jgi:hypothetical protein